MTQMRVKSSKGWKKIPLGGDLMTNILYSDLVTLKNNSELQKGMLYRITDYTASSSLTDVTVATDAAFDVVVLATSKSTLSEDAKAIPHDGSTYFQYCDLSQWDLKYQLIWDGIHDWGKNFTKEAWVIKDASGNTMEAYPEGNYPAGTVMRYALYAFKATDGTIKYSYRVEQPTSGTACSLKAQEQTSAYLKIVTISETTLTTSRYTFTRQADYDIVLSGVHYYAWGGAGNSYVYSTDLVTVDVYLNTIAANTADAFTIASGESVTSTTDFRGLITYMKDDRNNVAYYDFKGLKPNDKFTFGETTDSSIFLHSESHAHDNYIGRYGYSFPYIHLESYPSGCVLKDGCNNIQFAYAGAKNVVLEGNSYIKLTKDQQKNIHVLKGVNGTATAIKEIAVTTSSENYTIHVGQPTDDTKSIKIWNIADDVEITLIVDITYEDLLDAYEGGELVKGYYYRITNFVTKAGSPLTTIGEEFNIIVQATTSSTLSPNAFAIQSGVSVNAYFDTALLDYWEIKYDIYADSYEWTQETVTESSIGYDGYPIIATGLSQFTALYDGTTLSVKFYEDSRGLLFAYVAGMTSGHLLKAPKPDMEEIPVTAGSTENTIVYNGDTYTFQGNTTYSGLSTTNASGYKKWQLACTWYCESPTVTGNPSKITTLVGPGAVGSIAYKVLGYTGTEIETTTIAKVKKAVKVGSTSLTFAPLFSFWYNNAFYHTYKKGSVYCSSTKSYDAISTGDGMSSGERRAFGTTTADVAYNHSLEQITFEGSTYYLDFSQEVVYISAEAYYAYTNGTNTIYRKPSDTTTTITVYSDLTVDTTNPDTVTTTEERQVITDHKGVIYYMKDEYGNEAPFDFKSIKWEGSFTFGGATDDSLSGGSTQNKITSAIVNGILQFPYIHLAADSHRNIFNGVRNINIDTKAIDNVFNKNAYLDITAGTAITTASEYIKNYVFLAGFKGAEGIQREYTAEKINTNQTLHVGFNTSGVATTKNLLDESEASQLMTSIEFAELKSKINLNGLTPGMYYRITDYKTAATGDDVSVATTDYLPFDVIVLATSTNSIDENAFACARESIVYPCDIAFENWQLKYCLHTDRFEWLQGTKTIKFPSSKECTEQNALTAPEEWLSLYIVDNPQPTPMPIYKLMTADGSYGYGALESSLSAGMALLNKEDYLQKMIDSHYWNEEAWDSITVTSSTTIEVPDLDTFTRAPQYDFMPTDSSKWYAYLSSDGMYCEYTRHTIEDYATLTSDTAYFYAYTATEFKAAILDVSQTDSVAEGTLPVSIENTGVISYMQDEWHNIAPYDFKNILYKGKWTFTNTYEEEGNSVSIDASLNSRREISKMTCSNNEIKSRIKELLWMLNRIIIEMDDVYIYNTLFEADCHSITINAQQAQLYYNRFSAMCCDMIINTQDAEGNQHNFDSCVFDQNTSTYTITGNSKTETPQITYISVVNEEVKYKHLADIVNTPTITTSTTEPTSPSAGDLWVDTNS